MIATKKLTDNRVRKPQKDRKDKKKSEKIKKKNKRDSEKRRSQLLLMCVTDGQTDHPPPPRPLFLGGWTFVRAWRRADSPESWAPRRENTFVTRPRQYRSQCYWPVAAGTENSCDLPGSWPGVADYGPEREGNSWLSQVVAPAAAASPKSCPEGARELAEAAPWRELEAGRAEQATAAREGGP